MKVLREALPQKAPNRLIRGSFTAPFRAIARQEGQEEKREIEGYASVRGSSADGILILPEALVAAVPEFMEFPNLYASHEHGVRNTVGKILQLSMDSVGLMCRAMISAAEEGLWTKVKEGILKSFSIGIELQEGDFDKATSVFVATKVRLFDISIAALPVDRRATFAVGRESIDALETFRQNQVVIGLAGAMGPEATGVEDRDRAEEINTVLRGCVAAQMTVTRAIREVLSER